MRNQVFYKGVLNRNWQGILALPSPRHGPSKGLGGLTEADLKIVAKYRFEVWGCGYNWLKSNADSAKDVSSFITDEVLPYYNDNPKIKLATQNKVIVVTHSMGGLVARSLCRGEAGRGLVLGVVHGAMPSNGAAEAYTNMRQGVQDFVMGQLLGTDASTVGAVYSQCLGGLELLPFGVSAPYNPSPEKWRVAPPRAMAGAAVPGVWLFMQRAGDENNQLHAPSDATRVYDEIYKSPNWYGLLPAHNEHHFDPAGILRAAEPRQDRREIFEGFIDNVKTFHESIVGTYHPQSYAFWGASRRTSAVGEVLWEWSLNVVRDEYGNEYPINSPTPVDNGKGEYRHNRHMYTINPVLHSGDGTVPRASWEKDLVCPDLRGYCCIGADSINENGFGHQDAFHYGPAREASLYFIAKLVSDNAGELKT